MTKEEAITAMRHGKKITHRFFSDNEFVFMEDGHLKDEAGNIFSPYVFWADRQGEKWNQDWEIYKPQ